MFKEFPRLEERARQFGGSLSGGEQQMLAIARALMANPELILMDEPSEGLAPVLVQQIGEIMKRIRDQGHSILLVEQNFRLAMDVADYVYIISSGCIAYQGAPAELKPELRDKFAMVVREPMGIVGAITPWNLPILLPSWKLFPALLCGNTVVFKPAEDTPLASVMLIRVLEDAGVPPGVVNMINGYGHEIGEHFVTHPNLNMVSFQRFHGGGTFNC